MSDRRRPIVVGLTGLVALTLAQAAMAADFTWDGDTDNSVGNPANWVGDVAPANNNTSVLIFPGGLPGGASLTPTAVTDTQYFQTAVFDALAPTYSFLGLGVEFEFHNIGLDAIVNNSPNYQLFDAGGAPFYETGWINAVNGDIVINAPLKVGSNSSTGTRWTGVAGAHDIYFNVDSSIHPAGDVNGGEWTSSTATNMYARARGRFFMTNFAGRAYLGNIGTSYRGSINLDSTANGALRLTHNNSLGTSAGSNTGGMLTIYGGADHNGTLEFVNDITVTRWVIYLDGRSGAVADDPHILNVSGNNTLRIVGDWNTGFRMPITRTTDSGPAAANPGNWNLQSDSGKLTIADTTPDGQIYNTANVAINLRLRGAGDGQIDSPLTIWQTNPSFDIIKQDAGTWTLTSTNNNYTGTTTIEAGVLSLGGTGSIAMSSAITVMSGATFDVAGLAGGYTLGGAQALKGRGLVNNTVTVGAGASIEPGDTTAGTLSIGGDLNLTDGATLQFALSPTPAGANGKIAATGGLSATGTTTIAILPSQGYLTSGTYHLVAYSGPALSASNFMLTGVTNTARQTFTLQLLPNEINLDVQGDPALLTWKGGLNGNAWDANSTLNWMNGASLDVFNQNDLVTFDNTGSNSPPVNVVGNIAPGSMTLTHSAGHDYTISGGNVSVVADLVSSGSGDTTFSNSNLTVNGDLTVSGSGVVHLTGGDVNLLGHLNGSGTIDLANTGMLSPALALDSGTLNWNRTDPVMNTNLTGGGTLRKESAADITVVADNSGFTGPIEVTAGVLRVDAGNTAALGASGTGGTTVLSGSTLDVRGTKLGGEIVTLAGDGASGELGALVDAGSTGTAAANRALIGGIILAGDTTIGSTSGSYPVMDADAPGVFIQGNGHNLTVQGFGEWDFYDLGETHLANITLRDAATYFGTTTTLGDQPGVIRLQNGGLLGLDGSPAVTKPLVVDATTGGVTTWNNDNVVDAQVTMNGDLEALVYSLNNSATVYTNRLLTFNGRLTGTGALRVHCSPRNTTNAAVKEHDLGTVVLTSDANDYTGLTVIGGGGGFANIEAAFDNITLMIGDGGTTGKLGPAAVVNHGTLSFNRSDAIVVGNEISGTGGIALEAVGGTVTLTNNNSFTGDTAVNAGTLIITGTNASSGLYTLGNGAALNVAGMTPKPVHAAGLVVGDNVTLSIALATPDSQMDNVFITSDTLDLSAVTSITLNVTAMGGGNLPDGHYLLAAVDPIGTFTEPAAPPTLTYNGPAAPGQNPRLTIIPTPHKAIYLTLGNPGLPPPPLALRPDVEGGDPSGPDGDVDFNDYLALMQCMTGPSIPYAEGCAYVDLDQDGDVDQGDFAVWQRCYAGANIQAAYPACTTVLRQ